MLAVTRSLLTLLVRKKYKSVKKGKNTSLLQNAINQKKESSIWNFLIDNFVIPNGNLCDGCYYLIYMNIAGSLFTVITLKKIRIFSKS